VLEPLPIAAVHCDLRVHVHATVLRERTRLLAKRAHRLHELERSLPRALTEELYVGGRRRVTRGEHRLIARELRRLVADAVERATVREQDLLDPRVRPPRHLLHLLECGCAEPVKRERARRVAHIDAIEKQRVRVDVESQRRVATLHERHGADLRVLHAR